MARLLFITHCYPVTTDDMRGGFFLPLIQRLLNEGVQVDVLTPLWGETGKTLSSQTGFYGETIWRFPWPGQRLAGLSLRNPLSLLSLFQFLRRWHGALGQVLSRQGDFDGVLAAWGIPAGLLLWSKSIKNLPSAIWWLGTDFNRFDKPWFAPLLKIVASGCGTNWSNSYRIIDGLQRRTGEKAEFVPLLSLPKTTGMQAEPNGGVPRVLSIGRLEPVKGFDIGIRAAMEVMNRGVAFEYRLVGSGPQKEELARLIGGQDQIRLLGYLDNEALKQELESAQIVLMPSHQEGMPLVFFEALAAGKPVVVTDVGDLRKCLAGTRLGLVSAPGDVSGLADHLQRALAGGVSFDLQQAETLLAAYSLDHTVEAVHQLISKRE